MFDRKIISDIIVSLQRVVHVYKIRKAILTAGMHRILVQVFINKYIKSFFKYFYFLFFYFIYTYDIFFAHLLPPKSTTRNVDCGEKRHQCYFIFFFFCVSNQLLLFCKQGRSLGFQGFQHQRLCWYSCL